MAELEEELARIFSHKFEHKDPKYFGFSKNAVLYRDKDKVKMIGLLTDFKLPDTSVETIIGGTCEIEIDKKAISYISKEDPNLEFTLPIAAKQDDLIRSILKDPKTYAVEDVFTDMKKYKEKGQKVLCSCPIVYISEKYVIICAPILELSKLNDD